MKYKNKQRFTLSEKIYARIDKIIPRSLNPFVYLWLFSFFLLTILFAYLMDFLDIWPNDKNSLEFTDSLWLSLNHLLDTGTVGGASGWDFRILMLIATFTGFILNGTFIGLVTTIFEDTLNFLKRGRTQVVEKDHIVIIGWSHLVFQVIHELVYAFEAR